MTKNIAKTGDLMDEWRGMRKRMLYMRTIRKAFWQIAFLHMLYHRLLDVRVEGHFRDSLVLTFLRQDYSWRTCQGILLVETLSYIILF